MNKKMDIERILDESLANQRRVRMFQRKRKDGIIFDVPFKKRGNSTYAWDSGKQLSFYKQGFLEEVDIFSVMFITLASPYGNSNCECRDSWRAISKAISPFIKALKRLGAEKYFRVLESTSEGCCHAHILVKWNRVLQASHRNKKFLLAEDSLLKKIRDQWNKEWSKVSKRKLNNNAVSIRVCPNKFEAEIAFNYATTHLGYKSDITNALYRAKNNKATRSDLEKLFANYWAYKLNIKLYRPSKGLGKVG